MRKKLTVSAAIVAAISFVTYSAIAQTERKLTSEEVRQISVNVKSKNALLIDVRTPEEYREMHLESAVNIDFKTDGFTAAVSKLDRNQTIYLYCRSGIRSGKALEILKNLGFKSAYSIGGLEDLQNAGLASSL